MIRSFDLLKPLVCSQVQGSCQHYVNKRNVIYIRGTILYCSLLPSLRKKKIIIKSNRDRKRYKKWKWGKDKTFAWTRHVRGS